jgi:adenylate cyclase
MGDVFISYARETATAAKAIADAVRRHGYAVWLDDQILAHREYADVISERIDAASAVLVVWSEPAVRSQWVRSEANRGRENGTLVQLRIDDARLPMPFDQIQCVELMSWAGDDFNSEWQKVLGSIAALAEGSVPSPATKPEPSDDKASLAVVPFKDLSAGGDQRYFCEGIAEEIVMNLARLPGLRVASPAALVDADQSLGARRIAQILGVASFLEGSVRRAGDRARIAVRLVETGSGFTLWAETFDRDLADAFAVQDEIATSVVNALGVKLGKSTPEFGMGGTADAIAYDLFLRARQLVRKELESERRSAAELFREATRRDPEFALAYAGLADVLAEFARTRLSGWQLAQKEAVQAAERAIELAPKLAEAHIALGAALRIKHDRGARAAYERAIQLSPDDPAIHYQFARFLVLEGQKRQAIEHYERAFALAPDDYRYVVYTLQEYQALGDAAGEQSALKQSWAAIERHLQLNPDDVRALGHGAGVLALLGQSDEADGFIERALSLRPDDHGNLATLACSAMLNQKPDQALDLLERAVATGRGDKEWLLQDNDLAPLHGNPRFEALIAKVG